MTNEARSLSTNLAKEAVTRELTALSKSGLITAEEQRKVSTAVSTASAMREVSTSAATRYFKVSSSQLDIRLDTPISRARECLGSIGDAWEGIRKDFHRYRRMTAELRLKRAQAAKLREEGATELDLAQADVLDAEADEMESELNVGAAQFRSAMEKVNAQSARYAAICTEQGKEFTEADFQDEEIRYLVSSLLWYAAKKGTVADMRDKYARGDRQKRFDQLREQNARAADFAERAEQEQYSKIILPTEAKRYLGEIGIPAASIEGDIAELHGMRHAHDLLGPRVDSFEPKFESWIKRCTDKYVAQAKSAIGAKGMDRLARIMGIMDADPKDTGGKGPAWGTIDRSDATGE